MFGSLLTLKRIIANRTKKKGKKGMLSDNILLFLIKKNSQIMQNVNPQTSSNNKNSARTTEPDFSIE